MFDLSGSKTARFVSAVTVIVAMTACSHSQTKVEDQPPAEASVPAVSDNRVQDAPVSSDGKLEQSGDQGGSTANYSALSDDSSMPKDTTLQNFANSGKKKVSRHKKHKKHRVARHKKHVKKQMAQTQPAEIKTADLQSAAAAGTIGQGSDSVLPPPPPPPGPAFSNDPSAAPGEENGGGSSAWKYILFTALAGGLLAGGLRWKQIKQKKSRRLVYNT